MRQQLQIFFLSAHLLLLNCGDSKIINPPTNIQHGWVVQSPNFGIHKLYTVDFVDENTGYIIGSGGTIFKTTNSGANWVEQESNTDELLYKAFFLNSEVGWICNLEGSIFYTSNGGNDWIQQYSEYKLDLHNIFFIDESNGWAIGRGYIDDSLNYGSVMLGTVDGGNTWFDLFRTSQLGGQLTGLYFLDSLRGWIAGGYIKGTMYTEDGGHTWEPRTPLTGSFNNMKFFNDTVGIAYALTAAVLKTYDGGIFWERLPVITNGRWLYDMDFVDSQFGWLVGERGFITHTNNAGDSWNIQESGTDNNLRSVSFTNPNNGWAVGFGGTVIHTTDGGTTWNSEVKPTHKDLGDIQMADNRFGCAVGAEGTILRTTNGGQDWNLVNFSNQNWFYALSLPSLDNWYAVGYGGLVVKSQNKGHSWFDVSPNASANFRDVFFLDDDNGWIIERNFIYQTVNGGLNWSIDSIPEIINDHINSIFFNDHSHGWCTTYLGDIYYSKDTGKSWTKINFEEAFNLSDIVFISKDHGFAIGPNLGLFETKDAGLSWEWIYMSNGALEDYNSIFFIDSLTGWLVGEDFTHLNGVIYKTTDGGATWELTTNAVENPLYAVYFTDKNNGWICGENGTILHTNDGGSDF